MKNSENILIGLYVKSNPEVLNASLKSIAECSNLPYQLVLLIDGDFTLFNLFSSIRMIPVSGGRAAGFNALVQLDADIFVFLENGILVGPEWLSRIVTVLNTKPEYGLAGPSTNRAWNEQSIKVRSGHSQTDVKAIAYEIAQRYACQTRTLEPLYSLSDFCYVVKRAVVDAIGAADESYGAGPCWEMDYNIRAARAGFRGVWVCDAFVYRQPISVSAERAEQQLLMRSKRYYQDKFCARLEQAGARYSQHCRGDECQYFATPKKIQLHMALPTNKLLNSNTADNPLVSRPLVSCLMPTRNRAHFVAQSILYFQRQDYPHRELIIVFETEADLPGRSDDARIMYVQSTPGSSIGSKRNEGFNRAAGSIIAQWDDDDWYSAERLTQQIEPILHNSADITGLNDIAFFRLHDQMFWSVSTALFQKLFHENICGGSLVYRRSICRTLHPYPSKSLREDADFLTVVLSQGARLSRISGRELFVYVRHDANTWKFSEGQYMDIKDWQRMSIPKYIASDIQFYQEQACAAAGCITAPLPLASCIMPTSARPQFVTKAIQYFLSQNYTHKELIIVDDGAESIAHLIPKNEAIHYVRYDKKMTLGDKRNTACEYARGSIIVHWDDDDWMASDWLSSQVHTLLAENADVCGLNTVFFHSPSLHKAWTYIYDGDRPWVCGGTLCYTKSFWEKNKFPSINIGEDSAFVWSQQHKHIAVNKNSTAYIATVHSGNTSPKQTNDRRWHSVPVQEIERLLNA